MYQQISPEVTALVKQLTQVITKYQQGSDDFKRLEKQAISTLKASFYTYPDRTSVDAEIAGLVEKFYIHNLVPQSEQLNEAYNKLFAPTLCDNELEPRLNIVKMLIACADRPTHNLYYKTINLRTPDAVKEDEEEINWGEYLMEGIPKWDPPCYDSDETQSDIDSEIIDSSSDKEEEDVQIVQIKTSEDVIEIKHDEKKDRSVYDSFRSAKKDLSNSVQYSWFNDISNGKTVRIEPPSNHNEANIALLWEEYVLTHTLLPMKTSSIITEYMVIREVLWQLCTTHQSAVFKFTGSDIRIRDHVTISSLTQPGFKRFMENFLPLINILSEFKQIKKDTYSYLFLELSDSTAVVPPHTYQSYNEGLQNILQPVYKKIYDIECNVFKQEECYTLLHLLKELQKIIKPAELLLDKHSHWIRNFRKYSSLQCASHLLSELRHSQTSATNHLEHNIYVSLYLECLYKYITLIDNWLYKNDFRDIVKEFIVQENIVDEEHHIVQYNLKPLEGLAKSNEFFQIISTDVVHYGKNLNLLRVLKKPELNDNMEPPKYDSLYNEFIEEFLWNVEDFFKDKKKLNTIIENIGDSCHNSEVFESPKATPLKFKFPILSDVKVPTEMDRVENLLDTSGYNIFLVAAFENVLFDKPRVELKEKESIHQRLTDVATTLFPANLIVDSTFRRILKNRFSNVAQKAVDCLKIDYRLEEHFNLLKHLYLMKDELLAPFFYSLFEQFETKSKWGNAMWLTLKLSDLIRNVHPEMYQLCTVTVKDNWQYHLSEPAYCCKLFRVKYQLDFPLTLIITQQQLHKYEELLLIMVQVKWAHYSLVNLYFTEIELPLKLKSKQSISRPLHYLQMKLKVLRFKLLGIVSSILHHIFGSLVNRHHDQLTADLDQSGDIDALINAHAKFIDSLNADCTSLRNYNRGNFGFLQLLVLVQELRSMWKNPSDINSKVMKQCEEACEQLTKNFNFYFTVMVHDF